MAYSARINAHYIAISDKMVKKAFSTYRPYTEPRQDADFGRLSLLPLPDSAVFHEPQRYGLHAAYYIGDDEVVENVSVYDKHAFEQWRDSEAERDDD